MTRDASTSVHPDLEALRRSEPASGGAPRRPWLPRLTLAALAAGALAALWAVLSPVLFPPRVVTLRGVRQVAAASGAARARSFVQAAGWIEADPFPVTVRPLVRGVVERLDVLEGQRVTKDETVIAVLRSLEIENELDLARADLALREAEHGSATAALAVARALLEQRLALRAAVADREGALASAQADVARAQARLRVGAAALEKARVDLRAQEELERGGQGTPTALQSAAARVQEAEAHVSELEADERRAAAEAARLAALRDLAREALAEPRDLEGAVDVAAAEVARAAASCDRARTALAVAERDHAHLTIRAPADAVVMRLECAPGALVGPQGDFKGAGEGSGSTGMLNRMTGTLVSLYDPARLQARVDLPFEELPGIAAGTAVEIEAKALPGRTFHGTVHRLVNEADITQAKLQVKAAVADPAELLRPEMLCTVRFLVEADAAASAASAPSSVRLLVPSEAVRVDAVFVYDPTGGGRARRVPVRVLAREGEWTDVEGDLGLTTKVILEEVEDGQRVRGGP